MNGDNQVTPISKFYPVLEDTYAALPTTDIRIGQLAHATDLKAVCRWNGTSWDVIATSPGEGHITILPFNYSAIGQGNWLIAVDAAQALCFLWINSGGANADNISYKVFLDAGTYTLRLLIEKRNTAAILDVDIDAAEVATWDTYAAADSYNQVISQTGIAITASGLKTLKVRVDGRNGASIGWAVHISAIALWRTA